jgi:glycosyltransferase involved in cell wall biosynthesis
MLWMDVTTSVRNVTRNGIAGVEWHFVNEIVGLRPETRLVALVNGKLRPVDLGFFSSRSIFVSPAAPSKNDQGKRSKSATAARALLAFCHPVGGPKYVALYRKFEFTLKVRNKLQRSLRYKQRPQEQGESPCFSAGDCLISLGADWSGELFHEFARLKANGVHIITMVHDLIPLTHGHLAFDSNVDIFKRYYRSMLAVSSVILSNSQESKDRLLAFADSENITRTPLIHKFVIGARPISGSVSDDRENFFLCVGTIERRKNLEILFDAIRMLHGLGASLPSIVLVGSIGWGVSDWLTEMAQQSEAARKFIFLGPVDDADLDGLLQACRALVMPSHYEGWGLPLREAAATGTPVAVGDSPAVREALSGYEGATFLESHDTAAWAAYLTQPPSGKPRPIRLQTWAESVQEVLDLLSMHFPIETHANEESR